MSAAGWMVSDSPVPPSSGDQWVVSNSATPPQAPKTDLSSLPANPQGEGTYAMWDTAGHRLGIPYGHVPHAIAAGYKFDTNSGPGGLAPGEQFQKDLDYKLGIKEPSQAGQYWEALTNPVGSGGHEQGIVGGTEQVGGQAIKAMAQPVMHPIDTLKGMGNVASDAAIYGPQAGGEDIVRPAVEQYVQDKQQGGNALALENLVGSALGMYEGDRMGGAVASKVIPPVADMAAGAAGRLAPKLYESALKPSTTLGMAERASITQTALQHEIPVSQQGLRNLGDLIGDLNRNIKDVIAADPTRPIDPNAVATRVDQLAPRMAAQVNAGDDLSSIEASKQQFLREQGARPGKPAVPPQPTGVLDARGNPVMTPGTPATPPQPAPPMNAADAQAMKQGTYRALGDKNYGELKGASVEAQKALARGLKEEIANQFPELDSLNKEESRLLDLQPVLERAISRIANHQVIGLGTPMAGAAGSAVTGSAAAGGVIAFMKTILDNPMVKSRLAIQLSKASNISIPVAAQRVAAYSSALGAYAGAQTQKEER